MTIKVNITKPIEINQDFVTGSELNGTDVTASKMTYDWNENSRLTYNGLANYNWSNENHNISALGGVSYEHYKYQQQKSCAAISQPTV